MMSTVQMSKIGILLKYGPSFQGAVLKVSESFAKAAVLEKSFEGSV